MLRMAKNEIRISNGFSFNKEYIDSLKIAINKLMIEIDTFTEENRVFESNLIRTTLSKLVDDYRYTVGEYKLTQEFPDIYSYI